MDPQLNVILRHPISPEPRTVVAIHGISPGSADVSGYGAALADALHNVGVTSPRVIEASWADLAGHVRGFEGISRLLANALRLGVDAVKQVAAYDYVDTYRGRILERVQSVVSRHPGCLLVGHSLGSVIAVDLLIDWLASGMLDLSQPSERWPVSGLVTMGSPLGIDVPILPGEGFRDRAERLARLGALCQAPGGMPPWRWLNLRDPDDPVTSGDVLGRPQESLELGSFPGYRAFGVSDLKVNTGQHLQAHTAYWDHVVCAHGIACMASI